MAISRLVNRNVVAERGRTSMRLEPELWDMLSEICEREAQGYEHLGASDRSGRAFGRARTSAVRVYIAKYFYVAATEIGPEAVGPRLTYAQNPRAFSLCRLTRPGQLNAPVVFYRKCQQKGRLRRLPRTDTSSPATMVETCAQCPGQRVDRRLDHFSVLTPGSEIFVNNRLQ